MHLHTPIVKIFGSSTRLSFWAKLITEVADIMLTTKVSSSYQGKYSKTKSYSFSSHNLQCSLPQQRRITYLTYSISIFMLRSSRCVPHAMFNIMAVIKGGISLRDHQWPGLELVYPRAALEHLLANAYALDIVKRVICFECLFLLGYRLRRFKWD